MPYCPKYKLGDALCASPGYSVIVTASFPVSVAKTLISDPIKYPSGVVYDVCRLFFMASPFEVFEEDLSPFNTQSNINNVKNSNIPAPLALIYGNPQSTNVSTRNKIKVGDKIKASIPIVSRTVETVTGEVVEIDTTTDSLSMLIYYENKNSVLHGSNIKVTVFQSEILSMYSKGDKIKFKNHNTGNTEEGVIDEVVPPGTFGWHESYIIKIDGSKGVNIVDHSDIIEVVSSEPKSVCWHEWKEYTGLFEVDHYCNKCGSKKTKESK